MGNRFEFIGDSDQSIQYVGIEVLAAFWEHDANGLVVGERRLIHAF